MAIQGVSTQQQQSYMIAQSQIQNVSQFQNSINPIKKDSLHSAFNQQQSLMEKQTADNSTARKNQKEGTFGASITSHVVSKDYQGQPSMSMAQGSRIEGDETAHNPNEESLFTSGANAVHN